MESLYEDVCSKGLMISRSVAEIAFGLEDAPVNSIGGDDIYILSIEANIDTGEMLLWYMYADGEIMRYADVTELDNIDSLVKIVKKYRF